MSNLELRGLLSQLNQKKIKLASDASARIRAARSIVGPAAFQRLEEIDARSLKTHATELDDIVREYKEVLDQIKEIEKELL
jgi:flagellar biosynthesis chaperone FliJ